MDRKPDVGEAERFLNDPVFSWVFEVIRQEILTELETIPVKDREGREYLCLMLKVAKRLRGLTEALVREGKVKGFNVEKSGRKFLRDIGELRGNSS